jgi:hypothetical protein
VRFTDFLRTAVLLFGAAGTTLGAVAIAGAAGDDETTLIYVAVGWWAVAAVVGLWLGRRPAASRGIARLLASARTTSSLPELEPGTVLFTIGAGAVAFVIPQVPAIAAGYAFAVALAWRKQSAAVAAIEDRDGVRFYFDRSSPFGPPRLLRTPGFRRIEPVPEPDREPAAP